MNASALIKALSVPLIAVIISGLALWAKSSQSTLKQSFDEDFVALAYTCGYREGQVAITSRLPSLFSNQEDKERPGGLCPDIAKIAVAHGFAVAAKP